MEDYQLGNYQSKDLMYDIIYCSIPYSDLNHIYSAPAILKGVTDQHHYKSKTVDFGITLLNLCDRNIELFNRVQTYFISPGNTLSESENVILDRFYKEILDFFKANKSKFIGISVFSVYTHKATYDITKLLRDNSIDAKIVVGGRGAKVPFYKMTNTGIITSKFEGLLSCGEFLKKKGLVDYVVIGDGEDAILNILNGTDVEIVENRSDTFNYPLPAYNDYQFDQYLFENNTISFPITGSKGCVRDCDFCDIKFQFGKYRYRNGEDIANEMIFIAEKFNFRKFQFTDSLVNGGLKALEEFCAKLADYNLHNPDKRITWTGQYICRPENHMPSRLYKLMADSGVEGLTIGAESGSDYVLGKMNKKTTVEALYNELEHFREHNITCVLLTFVGHWSETFEEFTNHCKMFINLMPYVRSGTISSITIGTPLLMLDGTPSMRDAEKNKIHLDEEIGSYLWVSELNPENNYKERVYRRLVVKEIFDKLKIPCHDEQILLLQLKAMIESKHEQINKFHEEFYKKQSQ